MATTTESWSRDDEGERAVDTNRPSSAPPELSVNATSRRRRKLRSVSFKQKLRQWSGVLRHFSILPPDPSRFVQDSHYTKAPPRAPEPSSQGSSGATAHAANGAVQGEAADGPDHEGPGLVGLFNHGNTCYLNAILQCLSNTEPLCKYLVLDHYRRDRRRSKGHRHASELTTQLALLLKSMWVPRAYNSLVSAHFHRLVGQASSQYQGRCQQDAQEFLLWLLDQLHEDLPQRPTTSRHGLFRSHSTKDKV